MKFQIFKSPRSYPGWWYWRGVSRNGQVESRSSESYVSKYNAKRAVRAHVRAVAKLFPMSKACRKLITDKHIDATIEVVD